MLTRVTHTVIHNGLGEVTGRSGQRHSRAHTRTCGQGHCDVITAGTGTTTLLPDFLCTVL